LQCQTRFFFLGPHRQLAVKTSRFPSHTESPAAKTPETGQRLYLLDAWRETPLYTERERAALEWMEAVTQVADGHVPDEVYASARDHFSAEDLVDLTIAVIATNGFNRLNIAFRPKVGNYRPGMFDQPKTEQAVI
jgi:hypothetical protein